MKTIKQTLTQHYLNILFNNSKIFTIYARMEKNLFSNFIPKIFFKRNNKFNNINKYSTKFNSFSNSIFFFNFLKKDLLLNTKLAFSFYEWLFFKSLINIYLFNFFNIYLIFTNLFLFPKVFASVYLTHFQNNY
jgi:hypothetical protein